MVKSTIQEMFVNTYATLPWTYIIGAAQAFNMGSIHYGQYIWK